MAVSGNGTTTRDELIINGSSAESFALSGYLDARLSHTHTHDITPTGSPEQ